MFLMSIKSAFFLPFHQIFTSSTNIADIRFGSWTFLIFAWFSQHFLESYWLQSRNVLQNLPFVDSKQQNRMANLMDSPLILLLSSKNWERLWISVTDESSVNSISFSPDILSEFDFISPFQQKKGNYYFRLTIKYKHD